MSTATAIKPSRTEPNRSTGIDLDRYRALRAEGVPPVSSRYWAARSPLSFDYGDHSELLLTGYPQAERYGLDVAVTFENDEWADSSDLGEFTCEWSPDVLPTGLDDCRGRARYFLPSYTVAERRADMSRRGVARGVAQFIAERQVREDLRTALNYAAVSVTVTVRYVGVDLADAGVSDVYVDKYRDDTCERAATAADESLSDSAVRDALDELARRSRAVPAWRRAAAWLRGALHGDDTEPGSVPVELLMSHVAGREFAARLRRPADA